MKKKKKKKNKKFKKILSLTHYYESTGKKLRQNSNFGFQWYTGNDKTFKCCRVCKCSRGYMSPENCI